jgi:FkbH-like protein
MTSDDFLRSAEARVFFESGRSISDSRPFELVNKTNQFNLNGKRYTDSEWRQFLADPSALLLTAVYEDKYGPLGRIAVLLGTMHGRSVHLRTWVMSCRAFSRRIEHQCLRYLFDELGADEITFDYVSTSRNGPMRDFLKSLVSSHLDMPVSLTKGAFTARVPQLFHQVEVSTRV